ncbi:hypothetical protein HKO22_06205 [Peptoniphilus sp. AGMB00490]|uniref:Uncharacterized protein n=2 Tax=Peptoniphilus TaxID=162289 RepID=A0ACD6AZP2_9FIRM|nr:MULTISPECIES: hypothetical protein [Peptoniphilus]NMW85329.1 hypothetical protein [Peptoniphilus faecalis]OLR65254.1 hypothetical protein BIV18_06875 [Peptoniphilus porci]
MRRPLNYEILKYLTNHDKVSAEEIYNSLHEEYKDHKAFKLSIIVESLMTAKENGLINEDGYDLIKDKLVVYYSATPEQKETINSYIK